MLPTATARTIIKKLPYTLPLWVICILLFVLYCIHPYTLDDNWFREPFQAFIAQPSAANLFSGWKAFLSEHFYYDNLRLINDIGSLLTVAPKWLPSLILSAASGISIYYGAKIAGVWERNLTLYSVFTALYIFALPWIDFLFTIVFALNYILDSAILLCIFYNYYTGHIHSAWTAFALGLLCALLHEAFGAYLFSGVAACMLVDKQYRNSKSVAIAAGILLGVLILALVPGTGVRSQKVVDIIGGFTSIHHSLHHIPVVLLFAALTVPAFAIKRWRQRLDLTLVAAIWAMILGGIAVWRVFPFGTRMVWFVNLASIIGLIYILSRLPRLQTDNLFWRITGVVLLCCTIAHLALCIPWGLRMADESRQICAIHSTAPDKTIYYDITTAQDVPFYIMGKVNFNALTAHSFPENSAVPTALYTFEPSAAAPLESNIPGAMLHDGYIILPQGYATGNFHECGIGVDGSYYTAPTRFTPFTTSSGKTYVFARPAYLPMRLKWQNVRYFNILE